MRMNRRNVLIGLGTIVAGGGAALGTGAFSTVTADRTANIEVADDSNAFLALEPVDDNPYVVEEGGEVVFYFDGEDSNAGGLNDNAVTEFESILRITNNGSNEVDVSIEAIDENGDEVTDIGLELTGLEDPISSGDNTEVGFEFDLVGGDGENIDDIDDLRILAEETEN
ncbi:hypothetical protein AB7C87_07015 [Natrarchaeobius sp. A-rgal3]|uniref:hypothetical protein n=1 Tax=Natrarchaeobius versutus TaxID=1679078 RepID=UPI00350EBEF8